MTEETTVTDTAQDNPTPAPDAAPADADKSNTLPEQDAKDPPKTDDPSDGGEAKTDGEDKGSDGDQPDKPKRQKASERISELTGKWRSAQREAAERQREIERLEARLAKYDTAAPRRDDFDDPDEFIAANAAYKFAQSQRQEREADIEDRKADIEATRKEADESLRLAFAERQQDFAATASDYWDVVNDHVPINTATAHEIMQSDYGPQVAYYLGQHLADARRIERITDPIEVAREVARIEARVSQPPPRRTTQAPTPIQAEAKSGGTPPAFDPATASMDDYAKYWKKREGM